MGVPCVLENHCQTFFLVQRPLIGKVFSWKLWTVFKSHHLVIVWKSAVWFALCEVKTESVIVGGILCSTKAKLRHWSSTKFLAPVYSCTKTHRYICSRCLWSNYMLVDLEDFIWILEIFNYLYLYSEHGLILCKCMWVGSDMDVESLLACDCVTFSASHFESISMGLFSDWNISVWSDRWLCCQSSHISLGYPFLFLN